jgi:hypothetical protein
MSRVIVTGVVVSVFVCGAVVGGGVACDAVPSTKSCWFYQGIVIII